MVNKVIDAICLKISDTFGEGYEIYTENIEHGFNTPCFFIACENFEHKIVVGNRYVSDSKFVVSYYPKRVDVNKECFDALDILHKCLEYISVDERLIRGIGIKSDIIDGVLKMEINYKVHFIVQEEKTMMGELTQEGGLDGKI